MPTGRQLLWGEVRGKGMIPCQNLGEDTSSQVATGKKEKKKLAIRGTCRRQKENPDEAKKGSGGGKGEKL